MTDESEGMWVQRVLDAARRGVILDLQAGVPTALYDPATANKWTPRRSIPASTIRAVMLHAMHGGSDFDPRGVRIRGARITGPADFAHIDFDYPLHLLSCCVDKPIDFSNATLRTLVLENSHTSSLKLDGSTVSGDVNARSVTNKGEFSALFARIEGQLVLEGSNLNNPEKEVLDLRGATINGPILADTMITHGRISAIGSTINGALRLSHAELSNPGKEVLNLDSATINSNVHADPITTNGHISTIGAAINGVLDLTGANLHNPKGDVLDLSGAAISSDVFVKTATVHGHITAVNTAINGVLDLTGANLHNPKGDVLDLNGAAISSDVHAIDLQTNGHISARNARIEGHFDLRGVTKPSSKMHEKLEVDLAGAAVDCLQLPLDSLGSVNLSWTKINRLVTPLGSEPQYPVNATGWALGDVEGRIRTNRKAATRWLSPEPDAGPQPWHALASVYERNGHPTEARRLRFTAANRVTKTAPPTTKLVRWGYLLVAGHGYYPLIAIVWLFLALIGGVALVDMNKAHFVPTTISAVTAITTSAADGPQEATAITGAVDCSTRQQYPCLDSFSYALAGVVPAATGITRPDWAVSSTAPIVVKFGLPLLRILAWIFTAILLAGVTGLLRKSS
ncbi:hypothetical protein [Rhodococcus sp. C3V]|uniref:hypothetical protein n=1 Tax=Rhodococcus sp. C3V TaxID=3034165 RepID=UPI0023E28523|nr:hypothetical protein [Rhodococcus sp. C3V]MDF3319903.1 hypothetical protein [Rhodococcus sp. C3V]